jgi:cobalt-zinc-cadmium efflux system membrane fusion protein
MKRFTIPLALLTTLALAGTGCRHSVDDHGHDHEDAAQMAQITVWTDRYEVFAEHAAPVAGQPTKLITHVTDLHTQAPRREGMVKFILRQGETMLEHPQAAPAKAGLYLPSIVIPNAGDWQLGLLIPTDGTNAAVELGTIKVHADEDSAAHAEFPAPPEGVSFLKEQQWNILLQTKPVSQRPLVQRVRVPARVRAKPGFSAAVVAPLSGQLAAPPGAVLPQPGQRVAAGQLLALLKPNFSEAAARVAEADADFTTAKAALAQAEATYERTKKLAAEQAKSPREVQEAELAYQSAKARYAAAAGLLATFQQADGVTSPDAALLMELRAPIAGVLNSATAGPGEMVAANQSVFSVLNPEIIWIEAQIPEATVASLGSAKNAAIELPGEVRQLLPVTGAGRGQLVSLGLEVDATTRTVPLIYEMKNSAPPFRIGQHVMLHVETANAQDTLAIPDSALVEEGGWFVAYVQLAGETFEKRELRLGIRDGEWIQVLSGLTEGERVVARGAYALRLSTATGAIPAHGHAH